MVSGIKQFAVTYLRFLLDDLASTLDRASQQDNISTGSDATFELASFWLRRCLSEDEKCRQSSAATGTPFVPTRLIDVSNDVVRLIESENDIKGDNADRRYVALSHCWGLIPIIRTLIANYKDHQRNIDPVRLSKTFRDAVHATRKLGFRYVWIDSLCIIQDSKSDWEAEAATMCDVYRNATLTIAAAHAPGGDVGCFQNRDGLLQFPFIVELPHPRTAGAELQKLHRILFTSYGRSQGLGGPEPPLYGRAWVLQEQLLSARMLIFDGSQIRWECLSSHGSERSPQGGMSRHIGHQKEIRKGINGNLDLFNIPGIEDRDTGLRGQLQHWFYAVMDYTHRGMTKPSDRLVALDGVAQALKGHTNQEYYAGLWSQHFWLGLLWSISHTNEYTPTTTDAFNLEKNEHVRHEEGLAPSWSWVAVTVPIVYTVPAIMYIERVCEILSTFVSGSPTKQSGKVEIRGHLRTGYVNSIYPYAIREAAEALPEMTSRKPRGSKNLISFRGRAFHPNDFFVFSDADPSSGLYRMSSQNWRFVRGTFRPDEIINPSTQVTFIAIAQQNTGYTPESLIPTHTRTDPLQVYSLALVPTGREEGEYRRVGYAVWEDCSWYGYMCGRKSRPGRDIERAEGWRGMMSLGGLEHMGWSRAVDGKGVHQHRFQGDALSDRDKFHNDVRMEEKTIFIV